VDDEAKLLVYLGRRQILKHMIYDLESCIEFASLIRKIEDVVYKYLKHILALSQQEEKVHHFFGERIAVVFGQFLRQLDLIVDVLFAEIDDLDLFFHELLVIGILGVIPEILLIEIKMHVFHFFHFSF